MSAAFDPSLPIPFQSAAEYLASVADIERARAVGPVLLFEAALAERPVICKMAMARPQGESGMTVNLVVRSESGCEASIEVVCQALAGGVPVDAGVGTPCATTESVLSSRGLVATIWMHG